MKRVTFFAASPEKRPREEAKAAESDPFTSLMSHSASQGSAAGTKRVASLLVIRPVSGGGGSLLLADSVRGIV